MKPTLTPNSSAKSLRQAGIVALGLNILLLTGCQRDKATMSSPTATAIPKVAAIPSNTNPQVLSPPVQPAPHFRKTVVPFTLRNGHIYVQADLAGKTMECFLDTGSSTVFWNTPLHLAPIDPRTRMTTVMDVSGQKRNVHIALLPYVRVGNYTTTNVPTYAVESKNLMSPTGLGPLLGNEVFKNTVLTIDYKKKQLVIRSPDYDLTRIPLTKKSYLFSAPCMQYNTPPTRACGLTGTFEGVSVRFHLDTGNSGSIMISPRLARKARLSQGIREQTSSYYGFSYVERAISSVHYKLKGSSKGGVRPILVHDMAYVIPMDTQDIQAAIGYPVLSFWRITIDYQRDKVLLELNR